MHSVVKAGVQSGFLVSNTQLLQMQLQIARRIATNIQRILLGADAGDMPVFMQFNPRTVYNEATGLAIGFAPQWEDIIDAKVLAREQQVPRQAFSIPQAITYALVQNLDLKASAIDVNLASKDVRLAQSIYSLVFLWALHTIKSEKNKHLRVIRNGAPMHN